MTQCPVCCKPVETCKEAVYEHLTSIHCSLYPYYEYAGERQEIVLKEHSIAKGESSKSSIEAGPAPSGEFCKVCKIYPGLDMHEHYRRSLLHPPACGACDTVFALSHDYKQHSRRCPALAREREDARPRLTSLEMEMAFGEYMGPDEDEEEGIVYEFWRSCKGAGVSTSGLCTDGRCSPEATLSEADELALVLLEPHSHADASDQGPSGATPSFLRCQICRKSASEPVVMVCGHIFCHGCIVKELSVQTKCPVCQYVVFQKLVLI